MKGEGKEKKGKEKKNRNESSASLLAWWAELAVEATS